VLRIQYISSPARATRPGFEDGIIMKANELKRGIIVDIEGVPHLIRQLEAKSPSSRGGVTMYKVRYTNLKTQHKLDEAYKGDDVVKIADCSRMNVQYSYREDNMLYFMSTDDYSQYGINAEQIEDDIPYITDQLDGITALIMDGNLLAIELPQTIVMEILSTPPGGGSASATARPKPATLSTGLEIQVPEYITTGEQIKVSTVTGKFVSRA
jgi:elongation factor P